MFAEALKQNKLISYYEPWPGIDVAGNSVDCHVEIRISAQDAIARERYSRILDDEPTALAMFDETLLRGVMMSHHARFVE
jgi:hypothetical protein